MNEKNGLFQLEGFDNMKDDDLLSMSITEGTSEFGSDNAATNDPTKPFDTDATGAKDNTIPVPGGDKETPNAKPYDTNSVSVPGGDSETPSAKPYDANSISVPEKVTLTSDQYNSALSNLQKSFKEGVAILEQLANADVVQKTPQQLQEEYTESVVCQAMLESYEDGPFFEKVDRHDKSDVKKIVRDLRKKVDNALYEQGVKFYKPNAVIKLLAAAAKTAGVGVVAASGHIVAAGVAGGIALKKSQTLQQLWNTRLWQVLGICHSEQGNIGKLCDGLTEKFKEELGEYKVLYVKANRTLYDVFKDHFGWKDQRGAYFLLIDKKIPSEIRQAVNELNDAIQKENNDKQSSGSEEEKKSE